MSITRTDIFNFKSKTECDKYIANHKEFIKKSKDLRDTGDTLGKCHLGVFVDFFYFKIEVACGFYKKAIVYSWREQNNFDIHDNLVFDGG